MTRASETNRYALAFIFVTMLVDTIGLGIVIPVTPKIIAQLTGEPLAQAARYGGWLMFVFAAMQFLFAPLIGNLSDRFGRRPVLILSLVALSIDYTITGVAPTIAWLFLGRALSGIAGAAYPTVNAYIADVSPPEKRAANFGLTGAAFGIGFVVGPMLGGLIGQFGPRLPFFVSAVIAVANALFGLVVLKESLARENRRPFEFWRANPLGSLMALRRSPTLFGLIGVTIFMRLAHDANPSVWTYFTMTQFHWSQFDVGVSLGVLGVMIAFVFGILPRILIPRIGEARAVYIGLTLEATGFAGYALSTQGWMMYVWMVPWSLSGIAGPALGAIQSKLVGAKEQGELQGALSCVGSLTSIVAPPLLTNLFAYFTGPSAPVYFPGAAFLAAGAFAGFAGILFAATRARLRQPVPAEQSA
jgi:DHA1 family tetracycline resistance protein-like MFS transporter